MKRTVSRFAVPHAILLMAFLGTGTTDAPAQTFSVLYSFKGPAYQGNGSYADAAYPQGGVLEGADGVFYGTASGGYVGNDYPTGQGAIFRLTPPKEQGGKWTEEVIWRFNFTKPEGADPVGTLALDPEGNLYGATNSGGLPSGCGALFELSPPAKPGGAWTEATLHTFWTSEPKPENDACEPFAGLLRGPKGALYGTGYDGVEADGSFPVGSVFKLTPPATKGGKWEFGLMYQFNPDGSEGQYLVSPLVFGPGGLYSTAELGGSTAEGKSGCGVVFKLTPPAKAGDSWSTTAVYTFSCGGDSPTTIGGGVVFDKLGNLYGISTYGGSDVNCYVSVPGCGSVFELSPGPSGWTEKTLYAFHDKDDGSNPYDENLIMDAKGALYGATSLGGGVGVCATYGPTGCGVVFKLTPPATKGGRWTETVLHRFTGGDDGGKPQGTLIFDKEGNLYGTATLGGEFGYGTVFKIVP
jgi:hypothetical protein